MTAETFPTLWFYAGSEDAESWYGYKATREEAIKAGANEYPGEPFWLSSGAPMRHDLHVFDDDLDGVISTFQNRNEELFGEDGQGDPETDWTDTQCRDLAARLNATFAEWAHENGFDRAYMLDLKHGERIEPAKATDHAR